MANPTQCGEKGQNIIFSKVKLQKWFYRKKLNLLKEDSSIVIT